MSIGYSVTPLVKKLGIKTGSRVLLINEPIHYFTLLGEIPMIERLSRDCNSHEVDFIHLFSSSQEELFPLLSEFKDRINQSGMIWVSWPKKASKIMTDLSDEIIRKYALSIGLVDVKVCAVDEVWSGLKLVIPLKNRN
ncbi:hypothetical protein [Cohnella hashimotonis]|uniref:DUF3052 domain-containing protein n=1 Tax=Cohnella hashimotonis TaxID=2826895 RepID=A0ABT6TG42_9BACL|nr:hypothetical protein [Cohnella hashimotonis]MDI4645813.1 hypothetical protein [Cohnella hashimotonis]